MGAVHGLLLFDTSKLSHDIPLRDCYEHPVNAVEECIQIFKCPFIQVASTSNIDTTLASIETSEYPHHLSKIQFEEVFGMLVGDPEPVFGYFRKSLPLSEDKPTVYALHVFIIIILFMQANFYRKIHAIANLYANTRGIMPKNVHTVLNDFLVALNILFQHASALPEFSEASFPSVFSENEEAEDKYVDEFCSICFKDPQICCFLNDLKEILDQFSTAQKKAPEIKKHWKSLRLVTHVIDNKLRKSNTISVAKAIKKEGEEILWHLKASDYKCFWNQHPIELQSTVTCKEGLIELAHNTTETDCIFVYQGEAIQNSICRNYLGILTASDISQYFFYLYRNECQKNLDQSFSLEKNTETALNLFYNTKLMNIIIHLMTVVRFDSDENLATNCTSHNQYLTHNPSFNKWHIKSHERYNCIHGGEPLFNVLLQNVRGAKSIGVLRNRQRSMDYILGSLSTQNIMRWISQDMSLFNGLEYRSLSTFPSLLKSLPNISSKMTVLQGMEVLSTSNTNILLVVDESDESVSEHLQQLTPDKITEIIVSSMNIPCKSEKYGFPESMKNYTSSSALALCTPLSNFNLQECMFCSPDTSIGEIIMKMAKCNISYIFISEPYDGNITLDPDAERQSSNLTHRQTIPSRMVCASDIFNMLLTEQARLPRIVFQ